MRKAVFVLILAICCIFLTGAEDAKASYYRSTYETYIINSVEELDEVVIRLSKENDGIEEKYLVFDKEYFEEKSLIMIVLTNGLPYVEYTVENINITEEYAQFDVFNYLPKYVDCQVKIIDLCVPVDFKVDETYELRINEKDLK